MENRASMPAAESCSIGTPRGGAKPKAPPVPKLDANQILRLTDWADKHLPHPKKK